MIAIKSIIIILFGSTTLSGFIKTAIEMVGLWGIFRKMRTDSLESTDPVLQ